VGEGGGGGADARAAEFSLPLRVYIEDTDAGGIVYYVNYLKFMERARTEFMRSLGLDRQAIFNDALMFVVGGIALDYRAPARLDEDLHATASVTRLGGASLELWQRVRRGSEVLVRGHGDYRLRGSGHPETPSHPAGHACYTARRLPILRRLAWTNN
jgi:tol-pal system-associated acyl-CoA thioesterase